MHAKPVHPRVLPQRIAKAPRQAVAKLHARKIDRKKLDLILEIKKRLCRESVTIALNKLQIKDKHIRAIVQRETQKLITSKLVTNQRVEAITRIADALGEKAPEFHRTARTLLHEAAQRKLPLQRKRVKHGRN